MQFLRGKGGLPLNLIDLPTDPVDVACPHCNATPFALVPVGHEVDARQYDDAGDAVARQHSKRLEKIVADRGHSPLKVTDSYEALQRKMLRFEELQGRAAHSRAQSAASMNSSTRSDGTLSPAGSLPGFMPPRHPAAPVGSRPGSGLGRASVGSAASFERSDDLERAAREADLADVQEAVEGVAEQLVSRDSQQGAADGSDPSAAASGAVPADSDQGGGGGGVGGSVGSSSSTALINASNAARGEDAESPRPVMAPLLEEPMDGTILSSAADSPGSQIAASAAVAPTLDSFDESRTGEATVAPAPLPTSSAAAVAVGGSGRSPRVEEDLQLLPAVTPRGDDATEGPTEAESPDSSPEAHGRVAHFVSPPSGGRGGSKAATPTESSGDAESGTPGVADLSPKRAASTTPGGSAATAQAESTTGDASEFAATAGELDGALMDAAEDPAIEGEVSHPLAVA